MVTSRSYGSVTRSHFSQSPRHNFFFFLLFWSHTTRPAGRLGRVAIWNRRTPPLSSQRRPGHSENILPSSPPHRRVSADASHRSPPTPAKDVSWHQNSRRSPAGQHISGRRIRRQHKYGKHLPLRLPADHRRGRASAATNTGPIGADKQLMLKP